MKMNKKHNVVNAHQVPKVSQHRCVVLANAMPRGNFEGDEGPKSLDVRMCEMHFFIRL